MGTSHFRLVCRTCSAEQVPPAIECRCCRGPLGYEYDRATPNWDDRFRGTLWRYWPRLPVLDPSRAVTLGEADTPLVPSRLFSNLRLLWKDESRNPTGSHKDRALALAVTEALAAGARRSVVVSAGSTGLSNAAYAAAAGLEAVTLMARGAPEGRIWPLAAYDARIIEFDDDIDTIIAASRSLAGRDGCYVASTTRWCNPCQAEASKTIAYEIVEQLGDAPEWMIVPVGGGGTLAAIWRGFTELVEFGMVGRLPQMVAVVPKDYDAISRALAAGVTMQAEFDKLPGLAEVPTLLTKLAHVHPPDGIEALAALRESGGLAVAVDDTQAVEGTMRAARSDGLFLEPSSGVVVAALDQLVSGDVIAPGSIVVALGCGSGFRETAALQLLNPTRREHGSLDRLSSSISGGEH